MSLPLHPHLRTVQEITEGLERAARQLTRATAKTSFRRRPPRNATLRPGPDTPLWNALVSAVRTQLKKRGEKTNLGRELGLPPQRIHEFFVARTAAPDAERTLHLLRWLATRAPVTKK